MRKSKQMTNAKRPGGCPNPRRKMECAVQVGLNYRLGKGHFDTKRTHQARLRKFLRWLRSHGINRLHVVVEDMVAEYIEELIDTGHKGGEYALRTLKNEVSAINAAMSGYMPGTWKPVCASNFLPSDSRIRTEPPASWDKPKAEAAIEYMISVGAVIPAAVAWLAWSAGLRQREGILCNLDRWWREANEYGRVNVQEGTKGGRTADRWIKMTPDLWDALEFARSVRPKGSRCLLRPDERYVDWLNGDYRRGLALLKSCGIPNFHDLRAGYACHRFLEISGHEPPCVNPKTPKNDKTVHAQNVVVVELGHSRIEVSGPYIGTYVKVSAESPEAKAAISKIRINTTSKKSDTASPSKTRQSLPPVNHNIRQAFARSLPGSKERRDECMRRCTAIGDIIAQKFGVQKCWAWKLQHVRWALEHGSLGANSSRYKSWLELRVLLKKMGKYDHWQHQLRGPWMSPKGITPSRDRQQTGRPGR